MHRLSRGSRQMDGRRYNRPWETNPAGCHRVARLLTSDSSIRSKTRRCTCSLARGYSDKLLRRLALENCQSRARSISPSGHRSCGYRSYRWLPGTAGVSSLPGMRLLRALAHFVLALALIGVALAPARAGGVAPVAVPEHNSEHCSAEAVPLGERLISEEAELDRLFATRSITHEALARLTATSD